MKYLFLAAVLCFKVSCSLEAQDKTSFADQWEYVVIAVEESGYTIWGTSPIKGDDEKFHLFVPCWLCELKVYPGWRTDGEKPEKLCTLGIFVIHPRDHLFSLMWMKNVALHYGSKNGSYAKFERPQALLMDGKNLNIYGGDYMVSYMLKYKND